MASPPEFEAIVQKAVDEKIIAGCSLAGVYKTNEGLLHKSGPETLIADFEIKGVLDLT